MQHLVYEDGVIAVGLVRSATGDSARHLALRWLPPGHVQRRDGQRVELTNAMGGETGWFVLPFSLAVGVAKSLAEQRASGLAGFDETGFSEMVSWLVDMDEFNDAMCY